MQFPEHSIYKHQPDLQKADALAWVFTDKDSKLQQFPFEFPALNDDDVRIKILHTGLCHSDCLHARSLWFPAGYPLCTGHEIIGEITMIGSKVTNFKKGDIVGVGPQGNFCEECDACKDGKDNLCVKFQGLYDPKFGGYATHIQTPYREVFHIPQGMPLDVIPPLLCAGMTVFAPIIRWHRAQGEKQGLRVGVFGIGGLGHLALQYLNKLGHKVTAFTTSMNREKELKELGAHDLSHSTDQESLKSNIQQYDMILNTLYIEDKDQFIAMQKVVKRGGTIIQVGIPPTRTSNGMGIDVMNLVFNQISLQGSIVASTSEMRETLEFSAKHKIYPTCEKFTFDKFQDAYDLLENGRPKFRAVVNVTDWAKQNGFDK